jgi:hypothetical protein
MQRPYIVWQKKSFVTLRRYSAMRVSNRKSGLGLYDNQGDKKRGLYVKGKWTAIHIDTRIMAGNMGRATAETSKTWTFVKNLDFIFWKPNTVYIIRYEKVKIDLWLIINILEHNSVPNWDVTTSGHQNVTISVSLHNVVSKTE